MNIKVEKMNIIQLQQTRKNWLIKPATKVFKSKKTYNRKDKSWKKL